MIYITLQVSFQQKDSIGLEDQYFDVHQPFFLLFLALINTSCVQSKMEFSNPILAGFYPDPVCAGGQ